MGVEEFRVKLVSIRCDANALELLVATKPGIATDPSEHYGLGSKYFIYADGRHVIEIEVALRPVTLSLRFALCNPTSIDTVFAQLATALAIETGSRIQMEDDVPVGKSDVYDFSESEAFMRVLLVVINRRRHEWRQMFGAAEAGITTAEAISRFILPHCT